MCIFIYIHIYIYISWAINRVRIRVNLICGTYVLCIARGMGFLLLVKVNVIYDSIGILWCVFLTSFNSVCVNLLELDKEILSNIECKNLY